MSIRHEQFFNRHSQDEMDIIPEGGPGISTLLLSVIAFVVEFILFVWVAKGTFPVLFVVLLHVVVTAVLAFMARGAVALGRLAQGPILLAMAVGVMGPFGAAGMVIASLIRTVMRPRTFNEWFAYMFPEDHITEGEKLADYLERYEQDALPEYSVVPFREILQLGTVRQKQDMLGILSRHFQPSFMPALKLALKDENNSVRIQAATAMASVENRFMQRLMFLEGLRETHGNDPRLHYALAQLHDEHAYAGLTSVDSETESRKLALEHYLKYLEREPNDASAALAVGRLYARGGQDDKAIEWLESCIKRSIQNPAMVLWLMESYFRKNRFKALGELARRNLATIEAVETLPMVVKETVRSWAAITLDNHKEKVA
jgi:tetratricopeptide (TPR) repeat protein